MSAFYNRPARHVCLKILAVALLGMSCHKGDDHIAHTSPIGFKAGVEETRAVVTDVEPLKEEGFSVWGGYGGTTVFDGRKVYWGQYPNGSLGWTYDNLETWTSNTYNFYAVYPAATNATYTVPNTFAIYNHDTGVHQEDLLIATACNHAYPDNGETVNLQFSHALTAVSFSIRLEDTGKPVGNTYRITSATIGNVYTGGDITIDNAGQLHVGPTGSQGGRYTFTDFEGSSFTTTTPMVSAPMITMPQETTASLHIEIDVNGTTIEIDKADFAISWAPGVRYNYNLKITAHREISVNVTTTQWDKPNIGDIIIGSTK